LTNYPSWGWQSFARRDHLFTAQPLCIVHDALIITCTIQAQPQPPAGYWLGVNCDLPPYASTEPSGGGLSSWAGGHGASGGVAGGSIAAAERMTVVPKELVNAVAGLINDERESNLMALALSQLQVTPTWNFFYLPQSTATIVNQKRQ
jgi:hypothetical protein